MSVPGRLPSERVDATKSPRNLGARSVRLIRTLWVLTVHEFRSAVLSVRFVALWILVAIALLPLAYALSAAAVPAPPPGSPLWVRGGDGALAALAFAFIPLFLPDLPVAVATRADMMERKDGFLEVALTRSRPRWAIALGRYLGHLAAVSVAAIVVLLAAIGLIDGKTPGSLSLALIAATIVGVLILMALWLGLTLILMTFLTPGQTRLVALLIWVLFHAIRPTALILGGQFLSIVPIRGPEVFRAGVGDLFSFTGLYQGYLAPFVPDSLAFAPRSDIFASVWDSLAYVGIPAASVVLAVALVVMHVGLVQDAPLGRRIFSRGAE